jgi:membrane fusion protein, copper/silver efflux system
MKRLLYLAVILVLVAGAYWAGSHRSQQNAAVHPPGDARKVLYYVDPMNPAHTSDKPGKAPCGMDMEPVYADALGAPGATADLASLPPGTIKVTPEKQQLIGVRVATAEKKALRHNLRLLGKVATDETRIYRINATIDGWITTTMPVSAGSLVRKDETLAGFYSPEFLSAGQALIFALSSKDRIQTTGQETPGQQSQLAQFEINLKQYGDALRNLGMGERQIQEMIKTRKYIENVDITSPADGFILQRNVSAGQRFEKGTELFRIADLSRIWIIVDVFERDASVVQSDQPVKAELPNQGKTFTATVSKTLPQFDNISRTLKLRLEADNADFTLKPDMFVDVELPLSLAEAVVVPAEAVLDQGLRQTVFVDRGNGYFEPRNVHLGSRIGDQVQVVQGLTPGERIVVSGNFLLDSESRMKLAATGVHGTPLSDPVCGMTVDEGKARAAKRVAEYQGQTYGFCSDGCKKRFEAEPAKYLAKAKDPTMDMGTAEPKETKDLVCGMKVDVAEAKAAKLSSEHQGKTYYFCNEFCKKQFDARPEKYLMAAGSKAGSASSKP